RDCATSLRAQHEPHGVIAGSQDLGERSREGRLAHPALAQQSDPPNLCTSLESRQRLTELDVAGDHRPVHPVQPLHQTSNVPEQIFEHTVPSLHLAPGKKYESSHLFPAKLSPNVG